MNTNNDWHNIHITDKTGRRFFNTEASPMSTASEIKNLSRHLELIKAKKEAYAFVDADSAVLMLDGAPYKTLDDLMSDDDLLAELFGD